MEKVHRKNEEIARARARIKDIRERALTFTSSHDELTTKCLS